MKHLTIITLIMSWIACGGPQAPQRGVPTWNGDVAACPPGTQLVHRRPAFEKPPQISLTGHGNVTDSFQCQSPDGTMSGPYARLFQDGYKVFGTARDGRTHGVSRMVNPDGVVIYEEHFQDDEPIEFIMLNPEPITDERAPDQFWHQRRCSEGARFEHGPVPAFRVEGGRAVRTGTAPQRNGAWCELPDQRFHGPMALWPPGTRGEATRELLLFDQDVAVGTWLRIEPDGARTELPYSR